VRRRTAAIPCALGLFLVAFAGRAKADDNSMFEPPRKSAASPQNFALEIRAGIYQPQIDSDPALKGQQPFFNSFNSPLQGGTQVRWEASAEFDWQALHIKDVGSLGPGFGLGYYNISGLAKETGTNILSAESTTLEILPMYLVAVFRLDVLWRQAHIPFVPYAKAGLGYALWRASNTVGTSVAPNGQVGEGHTWGEILAAGLAFNIGVLDPNSVHALDEATGINGTYIFAEYMASMLNGIAQKDPLRVGSDGIPGGLVFGISFEF
jgi:hypothetical protein